MHAAVLLGGERHDPVMANILAMTKEAYEFTAHPLTSGTPRNLPGGMPQAFPQQLLPGVEGQGPKRHTHPARSFLPLQPLSKLVLRP